MASTVEQVKRMAMWRGKWLKYSWECNTPQPRSHLFSDGSHLCLCCAFVVACRAGSEEYYLWSLLFLFAKIPRTCRYMQIWKLRMTLDLQLNAHLQVHTLSANWPKVLCHHRRTYSCTRFAIEFDNQFHSFQMSVARRLNFRVPLSY
jgi:hypothetical protein